MMKKPNVLVIMPDTWRGDSLACAGHPAVQTPNVDRLASMGVRFDRAYSSSPVCMPARSNCISGQYCHNTGQWNNFGRFPEGTTTYMNVLQDNGWHTAHIGKSHFYSHTNKLSDKPFHLDDNKGFLQRMGHDDVFETTGPWATGGTESVLTDYWRKKGLVDIFRDDYKARGKVGAFNATWPSPLSEEDHMDTFVCRTAMDYLKKRETDKPFAVFVGIGGPHDPWDPPKDWADKFEDVDVPEPLPPSEAEDWLSEAARKYHDRLMGEARDEKTWKAMRRLYYAKIAHIDSLIGGILDTLEETGELDNTVIVFWSDHGDRLCDRGKYAKGVFYDESARVPIILRLPGNRGAGTVCNNVVSINDIFPTILDAAGIDGVQSFGKSLVAATKDPDVVIHDAVFSEITDGKEFRTMIRADRHKMLINGNAETLQLFDMQEDPSEMLNLANREDMRDLERALKMMIFKWRLNTETVQSTGSKSGRVSGDN